MTTFIPTRCPSCQVIFAVTKEYMREMKVSGASFSCPNGHHMNYAHTELQAARKRIKELEDTVTQVKMKSLIASRPSRPAPPKERSEKARHCKHFRAKDKLTQQQLADQLNTTAPYVSGYESDNFLSNDAREKLDAYVAKKLADIA